MTAIVQVCAYLLLLQTLSTILGKYVYVSERMTWNDAQSYCREFYTDLAPAVNDEELRKLREISNYAFSFWTGLVKGDTDQNKWMWSGGGEASAILWGIGQPDDQTNEDAGLMVNYRIYNANRLHLHPFFCFDAIVVRERASWEEALEHCREIHSDLASVTSQTDMLLIQAELDKSPFTEHVWVGLRFFPGGWRWTDKEQLTYEVWTGAERPLCPAARHNCGTLKVMGWMPSDDIDTSDILGTNDTLVGVSLGRTDFWQESEWEVHDCEQRLYFVCY
ncbi:uncharacterized protein LOC109507256 [Hippocampus comes]|uniref:uncharacterized protein LOC109507256 n=1 Tax=Hippocampus comes TaxID=109280 RepID=UPI00094EA8CD|nr:PREDICTED: uncharacterized protein LOC109507256 [Hippocampus comes]